MPLDPRAQRLLSMVAAVAPSRARPGAEQRRQSLAKLMQFSRNDLGAVITQDGHLPGAAGPVRYRSYAPASDTSASPLRLPGFIYFHGGGLAAGSIDTHDKVAAALAAASGCRLLSVDYRLAPENKFPAAVEDAIAATDFITRHAAALGIDASQIVVGGDSAGATLAAAVCQQAKSTTAPAIVLQCLICPVLDFSRPWPSREQFGAGFLIDRTTWEADLADYVPEGIDVRTPLISPLCSSDLAGLPPAVIHTAEFDPMRDEGNAYAARLADAGVTVSHVCHDGMVHNFHALGALLPQAKSALEMIGQQIRSLLAAAAPG